MMRCVLSGDELEKALLELDILLEWEVESPHGLKVIRNKLSEVFQNE